jgi:hypothetical protein
MHDIALVLTVYYSAKTSKNRLQDRRNRPKVFNIIVFGYAAPLTFGPAENR